MDPTAYRAHLQQVRADLLAQRDQRLMQINNEMGRYQGQLELLDQLIADLSAEPSDAAAPDAG